MLGPMRECWSHITERKLEKKTHAPDRKGLPTFLDQSLHTDVSQAPS